MNPNTSPWILLITFMVFIFIFNITRNPKKEVHVLHEAENVGVSEYYRRIIGYDSVEMIYFMGKWEVDFFCPNQWEFNKFKLDSLK